MSAFVEIAPRIWVNVDQVESVTKNHLDKVYVRMASGDVIDLILTRKTTLDMVMAKINSAYTTPEPGSIGAGFIPPF